MIGTWLLSANAAEQSHGVQDVFPPLGNKIQRLRFHTGAAKNNQPEISPILPDIPGVSSDWFVAQWSQQQIIVPKAMRRFADETRDPRLGIAAYAFTSPDHHAHIWIYQSSGTDPVYELYEENGVLSDAGGSNIFLSANAGPGDSSLDQSVEYRVDAKLSKASVEYRTPTAKARGVVLGQVFTGFVIQFPNPETKKPSTLFLQIPHSASNAIADYRNCKGSDGSLTITSGTHLPGDEILEFAPSRGPLKRLRYSVNRYICDLITRPLQCKGRGAPTATTLMDNVKSFSDWKIKSIYVGLETEAQDVRPQADNKGLQGRVAVGLQISSLYVVRDQHEPFAPSDCARFR